MINVRLTRLWKLLLLLLINLLITLALLYGFEYYLSLTDPFLKLPFDSYYYGRFRSYYHHLNISADGLDYTWGHPVINNRFGFRERDFAPPKPAGVCRITVLGDSLTWGAGLSTEERYTNLVETYLNDSFSDRKFEVLNFGVSGVPTTIERDILRDYKDLVNPDLVVVGFVYNDTQPKSEGYTVEKEQFNEKYGYWLGLGPQGLLQMGLPQLAKISGQAISNFVVDIGLLPHWLVGMQRTYNQNSTEWQAFRQALLDIRAMSDEMQLPPPIFAVLNNNIYLDHPTRPEDPDDGLPIFLRWNRQAERTAAEVGFVTYNHERELLEQLNPAEIQVNELDAHPSAKVNEVYGRKLFEAIATYVKTGQLCAPTSPQTPQPALAVPLVSKRLMRIRLGDNLRFLGYVATNPQADRGEILRLAFGWQALAPINANYMIRTSLLGSDGQRWAESETRPCHGGCPTVRWPTGMIAPPGSSTIYWPVAAKVQPLSLERVFDISHLKYRDSNEETVKIVPLPLTMMPFPGSLVDEHQVDLSFQLPPGEYTLLMTMLNPVTGEALPAYDEVAQVGLPAEVVLGKIVAH